MKGFTKDKKFIPMTDYKKVTRKSRDPEVKTKGVRLKRDQRLVRNEPDRGWQGVALDVSQLEEMYETCNSGFNKEGKASESAIANVYNGSATSHVHGRTSCPQFAGYCYYCGLNLDALEKRNLQRKKRSIGFVGETESGAKKLSDKDLEESIEFSRKTVKDFALEVANSLDNQNKITDNALQAMFEGAIEKNNILIREQRRREGGQYYMTFNKDGIGGIIIRAKNPTEAKKIAVEQWGRGATTETYEGFDKTPQEFGLVPSPSTSESSFTRPRPKPAGGFVQ